MEQERIESIEVELELAVENFESSLDDIKAQRFRRATSGFYFTLEHLAKTLLLTVGVEVESRGAVARMLGLHFVKSASLSARVIRHLGSLYERRHTAEYSPRAAWEFTTEEVSTYLEWVKESAVDILKELQKNAPEHETKLKEIYDKMSLNFGILPVESLWVERSILYKKIERSVSLILGILGNLAHLRHWFIPLNQPFITRAEAKINIITQNYILRFQLQYPHPHAKLRLK